MKEVRSCRVEVELRSGKIEVDADVPEAKDKD